MNVSNFLFFGAFMGKWFNKKKRSNVVAELFLGTVMIMFSALNSAAAQASSTKLTTEAPSSTSTISSSAPSRQTGVAMSAQEKHSPTPTPTPGNALAASAPTPTGFLDRLKKLSLAQLMNLDVTSVDKQPERYGQAPAAIQVITQDEIERSGAANIPEALRLADNLEVAQKGAHD
ncbi:MAG: hypothetical protein ACREL1_08205, partial [bacterium]